jgi:hypothetical protein
MTAPAPTRPALPDVESTAWRGVLVTSAVVLAVAFLLSLALRVSTNPLPGSLPYHVVAWLQSVATLVGSALVAAAVVLRRLGRR